MQKRLDVRYHRNVTDKSTAQVKPQIQKGLKSRPKDTSRLGSTYIMKEYLTDLDYDRKIFQFDVWSLYDTIPPQAHR